MKTFGTIFIYFVIYLLYIVIYIYLLYTDLLSPHDYQQFVFYLHYLIPSA